MIDFAALLINYGTHAADCSVHVDMQDSDGNLPCNCGWLAIRNMLEKHPPVADGNPYSVGDSVLLQQQGRSYDGTVMGVVGQMCRVKFRNQGQAMVSHSVLQRLQH